MSIMMEAVNDMYNWHLESDHGRQVWIFEPQRNSNSATGTGVQRTRSASKNTSTHANANGMAVPQTVLTTDDKEHQIDNAFIGEIFANIPAKSTFDPKHAHSGDKVLRGHATSAFKQLSLSSSTLLDYGKKFLPSFMTSSSSAQSDPLLEECTDSELAALNYYSYIQSDDGHWAGDYGGPMFLLPGLLISCYVSGVVLSTPHKVAMLRYLLAQQHSDGGWGIHIESDSTMFATVLNYISCRLLGIPSTHQRLQAPREFIQKHGGAMYAPSWAKFWLCVLGVMEWSGYNSVFPELWLLPESLPLHPWRWWCHCRMVYLPMAYIYSCKVTGRITELVKELRIELYPIPYDQIKWSRHRNSIAAIDVYTPQTLAVKFVNTVANTYEALHLPFVRRRASKFLLDYIHAEDEQTKYVDIGPVNKAINLLAVWHGDGPNSDRFQKHVDRINDYLWVAEDGMKMQGYNGSQLWDTAFATQAIVECGLTPFFQETVKKAYGYVEISQVLEDVIDRTQFYRHLSKGGWPFSTLDHGWPITDCTGEGIKATLVVHEEEERTGLSLTGSKRIDADRLYDSINLLLTFQNEDGGWATYENKRAGGWLERINPAEVFAGIMVDYSYVECSSASITALARFHKHYPDYRPQEVTQSIERGANFIKSIQRSDGSWYGSWAICFTYGVWFGVEGLVAAGESSNSDAIRRACAFLRMIQHDDGGWGESYLGCVRKVYVDHDESQVVNTAWACLSLMAAGSLQIDQPAIERGIRFLLKRQQTNGDWLQESISGVFNGNCMISYSNYRNIFPIWAIGRFIQWKRGQESS